MITVAFRHSNRILVVAIVTTVLFVTGCSSSNTATQNSAAQTTVPIASNQTLKNLQIAYNGESNAQARYLAFAQKADSDGYGKVASLFRAAARAEQIHAENHAKVIKELGDTPKADIKTTDLADTAANLDAAIKGESYERDTMYPDFLKQARQDGVTEAIRTFNLARNAEAEHAKLYAEARADLNAWKGSKQIFYVCPVCGFTTNTLNFDKCPSSFTPREKFMSVS